MKLRGNSIFLLVIMAVCLFMILSSLLMYRFFETKMLPVFVSSIVLVLATLAFWQDVRPRNKETAGNSNVGRGKTRGGWGGYLLNLAWIVGFVVSIYFLGFLIALPAFILSYMKWLGMRWRLAIIFAVLWPALAYAIFQVGLGTPLYPGLVFQ